MIFISAVLSSLDSSDNILTDYDYDTSLYLLTILQGSSGFALKFNVCIIYIFSKKNKNLVFLS